MKSPETKTSMIMMWQKRLLPFMVVLLGGLTIFFFIASFIQIYYLHSRIENSPTLDLSPAFNMFEPTRLSGTEGDKFDYTRWKTLTLLESHVLQRRYHQANVLLMARIWIRYLGFVTGMILALVGASFVLGKLRETETKFGSEGLWKVSIMTTSPGLILALLGTLLMLTTIITHFKIEVRDGPLYTTGFYSSVTSNIPPPKPLSKQNAEEILDEMERKLGIQRDGK